MQQVTDVHQFARCTDPCTFFGFNLVEPLKKMTVEFGISAHAREYLGTVFQQTRQYVVDILNRECIVSPEGLDCAFKTSASAVPCFLLCIAFSAEQYVLTLCTAWNQYQYRFRFGKAG